MSATKFRFTEQAIEKLSGSDKRARYYDSQMPGLIIDVLPSNKKTFRVYKKLPVYPNVFLPAERTSMMRPGI